MNHCLIDPENEMKWHITGSIHASLIDDKFTHFIDIHDLDSAAPIRDITARLDEIFGYGADILSIYANMVKHNNDSCAGWAHYAYCSRFLFFRSERECMLAKLSV